MAYKRVHHRKEILIVINFGKEKAGYQPEAKLEGKVMVSSSGKMEDQQVSGSIDLEGEEALIVKLSEWLY